MVTVQLLYCQAQILLVTAELERKNARSLHQNQRREAVQVDARKDRPGLNFRVVMFSLRRDWEIIDSHLASIDECRHMRSNLAPDCQGMLQHSRFTGSDVPVAH